MAGRHVIFRDHTEEVAEGRKKFYKTISRDRGGKVIYTWVIIARVEFLLRTEKLHRELSPGRERQMLYLGGSGGTGKSRIIHAVKALFVQTGCCNQLLVSDTTGTAAKLIAGRTIDSLCGFGRSNCGKMAHFDSNDDYDYGDSSFQWTDVNNSWTIC